MTDNLRGAILMTIGMAGFALEDMFIKLLSDTVPVGQVLALLGVGGAVTFGVIARRQGSALLSPALLTPPVLFRNAGEVLGTTGFVLGFVLASLSVASAILQATPLVVTLGAALFLGAQVGWRRWAAIAVGFSGVLLIVRPGLAGFEPASLFAVMGMLGLATRDVATRAVPATVTSYQLSSWAFALMCPTGLAMMAVMGTPPVLPGPTQLGLLAAGLAVGVSAYYALVAAMRVGEIPVVTPFRYTRMIFALVIAMAVFGERPDALTYAGAAIIIAAGLFTLWRETRRPSIVQTGQI